MRTCQRCGRKRGLFERLFALDDEYCDECFFDIIKEIRDKYELPVRSPQSRKTSKKAH